MGEGPYGIDAGQIRRCHRNHEIAAYGRLLCRLLCRLLGLIDYFLGRSFGARRFGFRSLLRGGLSRRSLSRTVGIITPAARSD